jgi:hypothetical protein
MAQMRLALRANSLHAAHAVARVDDLFDRKGRSVAACRVTSKATFSAPFCSNMAFHSKSDF